MKTSLIRFLFGIVCGLANDPSAFLCSALRSRASLIVFASTHDDFFGSIFLMNADGSGLEKLTPGPMTGQYAVWSQDGTKVAFLGSLDPRRGEPWKIYVMDLTSRNLTPLTNFRAEPMPGRGSRPMVRVLAVYPPDEGRKKHSDPGPLLARLTRGWQPCAAPPNNEDDDQSPAPGKMSCSVS